MLGLLRFGSKGRKCLACRAEYRDTKIQCISIKKFEVPGCRTTEQLHVECSRANSSCVGKTPTFEAKNWKHLMCSLIVSLRLDPKILSLSTTLTFPTQMPHGALAPRISSWIMSSTCWHRLFSRSTVFKKFGRGSNSSSVVTLVAFSS